MDNNTISAIFNGIYNVWWVKHRDNLPKLQDVKAWDALQEEGKELIHKYNCPLATDMVVDLIWIAHERVREREKNG